MRYARQRVRLLAILFGLAAIWVVRCGDNGSTGPTADVESDVPSGQDTDQSANLPDEQQPADAETTDDVSPPPECDDGQFCNGYEWYDAFDKRCKSEPAPVVDDNVACTHDECDEENDVVTHEPQDAACDNSDFCDGAETCDAVQGCVAGQPPAVDDGIDCTVDRCDEDLDQVVHDPDNQRCDNDKACDGNETCDAETGCLAGTDIAIDDSIACTVDACDDDTGLVSHEPDDAACDNGQFCDGVEVCEALSGCLSGTPPALDDGVFCTTDSCDEETDTIRHAANDDDCNNGVFCDGLEWCDADLGCQSGLSPIVDDGVACTVETCDEAGTAILHTPNDALCDNTAFCDGAEICDGLYGCMAGPAPEAEDGIDCTNDVCDEETDQVLHVPSDAFCDNGQFCDGTETCDNAIGCLAGISPEVDDGIDCTADLCSEEEDQIVHIADQDWCNDGQYCDGVEICDEDQGCFAGEPPTVDDGIDCTVDSCDEDQDSAVHVADDSLCDNGLTCDGAEFCDAQAGQCQTGTPPADGSACEDSIPETGPDICRDGQCVLSFCGDSFVDPMAGEICDDGNSDPSDGCSDCQVSIVCQDAHQFVTLTPEQPTFAGSGTTEGGSTHAGTCVGYYAPDHIYGITLEFAASSLSASLEGSSFDTGLYMRAGNCQDGAELACNDDYFETQSFVEIGCVMPGFYFVFVDGYGETSLGEYQISIQATPLGPDEACCGDGVINGEEACDDGNRIAGDGCELDCTISPCGNGVLEEGEACDDGNYVAGDGCEPDCTITIECGNEIVEDGEWCDDGNLDPNDGCDPDCSPPDCADALDNDDDGPVNYPDDRGCSDGLDSTEWPEIEDCLGGGDIDHDGQTDEDGVCSSQAPTAVCPSDQTVQVLQSVLLEGAVSDDHFVDWVRWEVSSAPFGSSWQPQQPWSEVSSFTPDIPGEFVLTLRVRDDIGQESSCSTTITAFFTDAFRVELFWNVGHAGDTTDVDLHLLNPSAPGWFNADWDCYYSNCVGGISGPWGGDESLYKPRLDIDDTDGNGPENVNIQEPEVDVAYRIGVHYYSDDGAGPSDAYVRIYCYGVEMQMFGPVTLHATGSPNQNDFWKVADVIFNSETCQIQDLSVEGQPYIIPALQAETEP